jgi:hypothetical protein
VPVGGGVEPGDPDGSRVGDPEAFDAFDGGGLAGSVGAEDPEDLPLVDGEVHPVDDRAPAVGLVEPVYFDDCHARKDSGGRAAPVSAVTLEPASSDRLTGHCDPRRVTGKPRERCQW